MGTATRKAQAAADKRAVLAFDSTPGARKARVQSADYWIRRTSQPKGYHRPQGHAWQRAT